jgi:hypothetical protein
MAWINQIRAAVLGGALKEWLNDGGPSDLKKSPHDLADEFCDYAPQWSGAEYRKYIEIKIGMHQRAEAEAARRRSAVAPRTRNAANATVVLQHNQPESVGTESTIPQRTEAASTRIARIAEYVFSQHPTNNVAPERKSTLRARALVEGPVPDMSEDEFNNAFREVYDTARSRPRKSGWPLQERYAGRYAAIKRRLNR